MQREQSSGAAAGSGPELRSNPTPPTASRPNILGLYPEIPTQEKQRKEMLGEVQGSDGDGDGDD